MPASHEPFYLPPSPSADLRQMLRRRIVATALTQIEASAHERDRIGSAAGWRGYGAKIRRRFAAAIDHPSLRLAPRWRERPRGRRGCEDFGIENLLVESLPGAWMNVTVWKPDPRRWAPPWPAVVTPVGHNGKYNASEQYPPQVFAANGYLSVSFDPPGFGEKARGNNHFEDGVRGYVVGQNPLAFFLADARRAVDYVLSRPDVDGSDGVTMTGVSGGGFTSICCALLDDRLSVIAPSCFGLSDEVHPIRNGYAACPETLWPNRFGDGLELESLLIGARFIPLLMMMGAHDSVMTSKHVARLAAPVREAYAGAGCPERVKVLIDDCGHEYSVAQALAVVAWMRRWQRRERVKGPVIRPGRLELIPERDLKCSPPYGFCMAHAAEDVVRTRRPATRLADVRRGLAGLIPDWKAARRHGLAAHTTPGSKMELWLHSFQEFSLRDGPQWELPATAIRPPQREAGVLVFFDDRGRWAGLHQWGWLNRVAGTFRREGRARSVLAVELPGWGDTRPMPSPYDVVGWGGVDRWSGYLSSATGESVMAMRLRDAVRAVDFVTREWGIPARRITIGGRGLGATVAGLAACLHGGIGSALLLEPLAEFADLATTVKSAWPHDAYFSGILGVADLPEALALLRAPTLVVGARDGQGQPVGSRRVFHGRHVKVIAGAFNSSTEPQVLTWLHSQP